MFSIRVITRTSRMTIIARTLLFAAVLQAVWGFMLAPKTFRSLARKNSVNMVSISSLLTPNVVAPLLLTASVYLASVDVKMIKAESEHVLSILQQVEIKNKKGIPVYSDIRRGEEAQAKIAAIADGLTNRFNAAVAAMVLVWTAVYAFGK